MTDNRFYVIYALLDGLVLVDLRKTDPARLETYMGKEGVGRFLEYHGACVAASR